MYLVCRLVLVTYKYTSTSIEFNLLLFSFGFNLINYVDLIQVH
jgi:hypothetical protein